MRKRWIRGTAACMLAALLIGSVALESKIAAKEAALSESPLEAQARAWVKELSGQAPGGSASPFAEWRDATFAVSPLGPGTHSWLVLLKKNNRTVGYLVVHAKEEGGFLLGEYGTGAQPPYGEQSLRMSLRQLERKAESDKVRTERLYMNPLQAAWRITAAGAVLYTDAWSGEYWPADAEDWRDQAEALPEGGGGYGLSDTRGTIAERRSLPSFDPYGALPWLTKKPIALDGGELAEPIVSALSAGKQLRFTAESFGRKLRQVWSVVGYDRWNDGQLYLALDSDEAEADRRYIPVKLLAELGHFYR